MSVFISDILELPALKGAKIIGGKSALSRIVSAVTVLEYAEPEILHDVTHGNAFYRSEIGITGFLNNPNDVDRQVSCIRRMAEEGEVGLILFYVGIYMKRVDEQLIRAADECNFALICMPENDLTLRYSDVIYEIMELIFKDQGMHHSYVYDILDQVSGLCKERQTIQTVLSMLSDELLASLILTDSAYKELYRITWRDTRQDAYFPLREQELPVTDGIPVRYGEEREYWMYRLSIPDRKHPGTELFILKKGKALEEDQKNQAAELIRLALSIWGGNYGEEVIEELVHAILKDEPMKMKRLANLFHVDTDTIQTLWFFCRADGRKLTEKEAREVQSGIGTYTEIILMNYYEDAYIVFSGKTGYKEEQEIKRALEELSGGEVLSVYCPHMTTTEAVRAAYLMIKKNMIDASRIFRRKMLYALKDIEFIEECRTEIEKGEDFLQKTLKPIRELEDTKNREFMDTLSTYLLDAGMSVQRTGEFQYLHKNTVKYRIRRIAEITGIHPDEMPGTFLLYKAVVIKKLMELAD